MKRLPAILFILLLSLSLTQCTSGDSNDNYESDLEELVAMRTIIEDLANSSTCSESTECRFIAFGSKPCGGPWSYLIYSTSVDTDMLEGMVATYNNRQAAFNAKYGEVSDCAFVNPPALLLCENDTCIAGS